MSDWNKLGNSAEVQGTLETRFGVREGLNSRGASGERPVSLRARSVSLCGGPRRSGAAARSAWREALLILGAAAVVLVAPCFSGTARGQQPGETKLPTRIRKLQGGDTRQAFTGKVQSVDNKLKVLNMKSEEGTGTEIFPLKKNVEVRTVEGVRRELSDLKPGSSVTIFYEFKGNQREIKKIIMLTPGTTEARKKSAPPS